MYVTRTLNQFRPWNPNRRCRSRIVLQSKSHLLAPPPFHSLYLLIVLHSTKTSVDSSPALSVSTLRFVGCTPPLIPRTGPITESHLLVDQVIHAKGRRVSTVVLRSVGQSPIAAHICRKFAFRVCGLEWLYFVLAVVSFFFVGWKVGTCAQLLFIWSWYDENMENMETTLKSNVIAFVYKSIHS